MGVSFSLDGSTNWLANISITIGTSQTNANFYFRNSSIGSSVLTLSSTGLLSDSQIETIVADMPTKISLSVASTTLTAGQVSSPITVNLLNKFDLAYRSFLRHFNFSK